MKSSLILAGAAMVAGCAMSDLDAPSLARRPAEAIDPRLPVEAAIDPRPADAALAAELSRLIGEARAAAAAFDAAEPRARALAEAAGPAQSESWIAAQLALSELERTRAPSARAAADVDAMTAARIRGSEPANPNDLAALEAAAGELRGVNERQIAVLEALSARLSR